MTQHEDLNSAEIETKVAEIMEPFEARGIVQPRNYGKRRVWGTSVSQSKLMQAVVKGIQKKGEDPYSLVINGKRVLLALLPFIMYYKASDDSVDSKLEEYLKELDID